jgi:Protein of unknown function (DUF3616)
MREASTFLLRNATFLIAATSVFGIASSAELSQPHKLVTPNHFAISEGDKEPRGISGMACLGNDRDAERECLVINDEEPFGQIARLTVDRLIAVPPPDGQVTFVKDHETGKGVVGRMPDTDCPDKPKGFEDLDGEGVAFAGGYLYISGSHSCSGKGHFKPSNYLLTRFKVDGPNSIRGAAEQVVERTWRLSDALRASNDVDNNFDVGKHFGKEKTVGTNIEGIAVIGDQLYAGLRTPVHDEHVYIVSAPIKDLFAAGDAPLGSDKSETIPVALPTKNTGIRDLAALKSGGLLILTGPTQDQEDIGYHLYRLDKPVKGAELEFLGEIKTETSGDDGRQAKAETISILQESDHKLTVLVMYDNINEGEPTRYEIDLRR